MGEEDRQIGEALVKEGVITPKQLETALNYQKSIGGRLGRILVKLGHVKEETLLEFVARQQGLEVVNLRDFQPQEKLMKLAPREFWEGHAVIPYSLEGSVLKVAMSDAGDIPAIDELRFTTSLDVVPVLASAREIQAILNRYYYGGGEAGRRPRVLSDPHELAREIEARGSVKPKELLLKEARELVDGANPARLAKALALFLVRKGLATPRELADTMEQLD